MLSLLEHQRRFSGALLARESDVAWGVAAYRNNVFGNWSGALANAYPIVRKIVGERFFAAMAREYAHEHPSTSGDLSEYGARLPGFVAAFPHTQDLPYLPDVARMEWLAHLAYYAADAMPFEIARLAALPPESLAELKFSLAPGSALLRSDWPLARIWQVHQDGYTGDTAVEFTPGPHHVFIHRPRWDIKVHPVSLGEHRFLAGAGRGEPLGGLLEAAALLDPAFDPAAVLARWVGLRALSL